MGVRLLRVSGSRAGSREIFKSAADHPGANRLQLGCLYDEFRVLITIRCIGDEPCLSHASARTNTIQLGKALYPDPISGA